MHPLQHQKTKNIPTVNFDLLTNGSTLYDFQTNKQIELAFLNS